MSVMANDTRRFGADVASFRSGVTRLGASRNKLKSDMSVLQNMWTGEAHEALQSRFEADFEKLEDLVHHFEMLATSLEHAQGEYETCENSVSTIVDDLSV